MRSTREFLALLEAKCLGRDPGIVVLQDDDDPTPEIRVRIARGAMVVHVLGHSTGSSPAEGAKKPGLPPSGAARA